MKTIEHNGQTINLTTHAAEGPKTGRQSYEAGRDGNGRLYFKGKSGRWTVAHQTANLAARILASA